MTYRRDQERLATSRSVWTRLMNLAGEVMRRQRYAMADREWDTWQPTPRWHPARWIGWKWRKRRHELDVFDPMWEYSTERALARQHLKEQFDV